jgi:hypothetical protein
MDCEMAVHVRPFFLSNRIDYLIDWPCASLAYGCSSRYSTSLLRLFFAHSLLDIRTLIAYLVNQLAASNLVQLGFVVQLVEQYEIDILSNAQMGKGMIEYACVKIKEVDGSLGSESLRGIKIALVRILQVRLCLAIFVNFLPLQSTDRSSFHRMPSFTPPTSSSALASTSSSPLFFPQPSSTTLT